jgi:DNA-binding HxlR family transcriptional regulator
MSTLKLQPDYHMPPFVDLCHFAWGIPVLAALARLGGAKGVTLARSLDIASETARRTLGGLIDLDLVLRNPGYGHPLRPEYILAPAGEDCGESVIRLWDRMQRLDADAMTTCRKKWSLPALVAIHDGHERFGEIQSDLAPVTPRALTIALEQLCDAALIEREVDVGPPVRTRYALHGSARRLAAVARAVARSLSPVG